METSDERTDLEEWKSKSVNFWSCDDVACWLRSVGFQQYEYLFSKEHHIDGSVLISLSEKDLRQPPLQLNVLGDIKRLMLNIRELRLRSLNVHGKDGVDFVEDRNKYWSIHNNNRQRSHVYQDSNESDDLDSLSSISQTNTQIKTKKLLQKEIPQEIWKTALSFVYVFCVFMVTAFVMVIVHDRVPEMEKYPPLPDIFLDNMPYVPWAFDVCEIVGVVLSVMWFTLLFFHKHRFILMRRMFSLMGTIFLLRCVTMLITSLSVPGKHLKCRGKHYGDLYSRLERTFEIWRGMGMSLQGVRTCGDYMFSGHTSIITLLNFFITEYTPRKFYYIHIVSWCLNFFGIFFLLAAHEHYTLDVFMAFYLSSRLFMYYHTLANNRALMQLDANRTRIWFPLFSFFEGKCTGKVPNEFQWPLDNISQYLLRKLSFSGTGFEEKSTLTKN